MPTAVYTLCKDFDERQSLMRMKQGKKRDDACVEFFAGALYALKLCKHKDEKRVELFLGLSVCTIGFKACLIYASEYEGRNKVS